MTCKNFNTDWVLWWVLILEEYGPDIKYILGDKYISADALSRLLENRNKETIHESEYTMENMPELCDIK